MRLFLHNQTANRPFLAWLTVALAGTVAPALALFLIVGAPDRAPLALVAGPILAVGLMGAGMIAAAASGRLSVGAIVALLNGAGLLLGARALGMPVLSDPVPTLAALFIASISFAARGALFARSASARGWWIALAVVAGEAAVLLTAAAMPGALPGWLLALLPAQWASIAIQSALTGMLTGTLASSGARVASAALFALARHGRNDNAGDPALATALAVPADVYRVAQPIGTGMAPISGRDLGGRGFLSPLSSDPAILPRSPRR